MGPHSGQRGPFHVRAIIFVMSHPLEIAQTIDIHEYTVGHKPKQEHVALELGRTRLVSVGT